MKTLATWFSIGILAAAAIALEGGNAGHFIKPNAALLVFGPLAAYLLINLGIEGSLKFWKRIVSGLATANDNEIAIRLETLSYLFGGIGIIAGLIHVVTNLAEPTRIGAGLAVCFMCLFYALIIPIVLHSSPLSKSGQLEVAKAPQRRNRAAGFVFVGILLLLFAGACCLWALATPH